MEIKDADILVKFNDPVTKVSGFNLLVEKYQQKIYWHVRRLVIDHEDANDVVQNVFIKVWNGLENFRSESLLYTWIYRIATNEALSFLQQKNKRASISTEDEALDLNQKLKADRYFDGDELQVMLVKAIASLPEKQRVVFNLRYYDEMKYEQMAEVLETSVGALKASYHHAAKKIEKFITGH